MLKKSILFLSSLSILFSTNSKAEEVRNFDSKSDIKVGAVLKGSYPFWTGNNLIGNVPSNISFEIRGESFMYGISGIVIDYSSYTRKLLEANSTTPLYASQIKVSSNIINAINKSFLGLTLYSSPSYDPKSNLENGWIGGIISESVSFSQQFVQGENFGNIGFNLGFYSRYYGLYPFVPSINAGLTVANLYDHGTVYVLNSKNSVKFSSAWKLGYKSSINLDYYITKDILLTSNIILNNFELFNPFPAKLTTETVTQPTASQQSGDTNTSTTTENSTTNKVVTETKDYMFNLDEQVNSVSLGIGYLF